MSFPKIAVTTASGGLGSAIVRRIIQESGKNHVIGIARSPEKAAHHGIEIRKGDYTNRGEFDQALSGIDTLLLVSGMDDPRKRVLKHRNVIDAAKAAGVGKIVYTSIIGSEKETDFSPIVQSNRQTEEDVKNSGLEWVIGRNGLYIEPDLEYIATYIKEGGIINCAGEGETAYTSRDELAFAYWKMMVEEKHNGKTYNLLGEPITQVQLAELINQVYHTNLTYTAISTDAYKKSRQKELGEFLGTVISGIYVGIRNGLFTATSDYEKAAGRTHLSALEMIRRYKDAEDDTSN
ncbi:MAG: NAD(P)H-binding protein [Bacteroidales bacterium]|nr:NAD(P)H-binding protein [Bacteroidales bacterium]